MDEIRTTGKTVDDALTEALIQLGTTSDQVEYDVIEKGSSGFFGFGSKLAVIEVRRKKQPKPESVKKFLNEEKKEEKAAVSFEKKAEKTDKAAKNFVSPEKKQEKKKEEAAPVKEASVSEKEEKKPEKSEKPATPLNGEEVKEKTDVFLKDIFKAMNMDVQIEYQIEEEARVIGIELKGSDMGVLIGKRGQTLDSLQYLISLVVNRDTNEYIRVKLDTENYRRRRRATLENLAKNIAYKVKRERKPITLEPMNPYERRIIHSTLQNDRYVETHSEGAEPYRRVVISLKKNQ